MIKNSTLFILLAAIALGAAVYYFDWKRGQKEAEKPADDNSKPAFSIPANVEIVSVVLTRPQTPGESAIRFEKQNGTWQIVSPIETAADQHAIDSILEGIGGARVESTQPGGPDRLKVYGLDVPTIALEFKLKDGPQHTLKLGNKDFTNTYVYAIVDGAKDVALLPLSLRTQSDLPLKDLRDHDVLHFAAGDIVSFALKNASGQVEAKKTKDGWVFAKPVSGPLADDADVKALLNSVATGTIIGVESESAGNLYKYGLNSPVIIFTASDESGKSATLIVGKKEGEGYFAKDASRPTIFRINESLYKTLTQDYSGLRDKKLVHATQSDFIRAELQNANGTVVITPKSEQEWIADAPPELKGKAVATWKILNPVITARAEEIVDHPSAEILSKLAKPLVQLTLTSKDGKNVIVSFTAVLGDFVYARTSDAPTVYKLKKSVLDDLTSKPLAFAY